MPRTPLCKWAQSVAWVWVTVTLPARSPSPNVSLDEHGLHVVSGEHTLRFLWAGTVDATQSTWRPLPWNGGVQCKVRKGRDEWWRSLTHAGSKEEKRFVSADWEKWQDEEEARAALRPADAAFTPAPRCD